MIRNEREYKITKAQTLEFERALFAHEKAFDDTVHPRIRQAQQEAIRSQVEDLRTEIAEYEALRDGTRSVLELASFEELPLALIAGRIAAGLTQRELAQRLQIPEQQVQRYEATDYASASFTRLKEVAQALGIVIREDVFLAGADVSKKTLVQRLAGAGLEKSFIERQILGGQDDDLETGAADVMRGAGAAHRIFGWSSTQIFSVDKMLPPPSRLGANSAYFKIHGNAQETRTLLLATYARYIAGLAVVATPKQAPRVIPQDAQAFRENVLANSPGIDLRSVLASLWSLGIVVVPLRESGGFHGACWRFDGRNVIVLKQSTHSEARWLHDLLHEVYHAGEEPGSLEFERIDDQSMPLTRRNSPEEQRASRFAGEVALNGRAEELAQECVDQAKGSVERLKAVVPIIASRHRVSVGSLANYMAWRLSLQGQNWWGPASNLQKLDEDPWRTVRDFLIEKLDFAKLDRLDRDLMIRALEEE